MGFRPPRRSVLISRRLQEPAQSKLDFVSLTGVAEIRGEIHLLLPETRWRFGKLFPWISRVQADTSGFTLRGVHAMDRRIRIGLGGIAALLAGGVLLCSAGCRSTRSEVPAGKPYQTTGAAPRRSASVRSRIPATANGMSRPLRQPRPRCNGPGRHDSRLAGQAGNGLRHAHPRNESRLAHGESVGPPGTSGTGGTAPGGTGPLTNSLLNAQPPVSQVLAKDPSSTSTIPGSNGGPGGSYP